MAERTPNNSHDYPKRVESNKRHPQRVPYALESVASADLHQHTHYGSPIIPPRLTATTSGFLVLPCYYYSKTEYQPQHFLKGIKGVLQFFRPSSYQRLSSGPLSLTPPTE